MMALYAPRVWANGVRLIPTLLRDRYEFGVLFVLVRGAGTTAGFLGAIASAKPWRAVAPRR